MKSMPVAISLHLCDYLIVEDRTRKVSLVGTFTGLPMAELPGVAPPFSVTAVLTDGLGEGIIDLVVTRLDTGEEVHNHRGRITFPDMLQEVTYHIRLARCPFPVEGTYQFALLVDGEWVAHRRLRVYQRQERS